MRPRIVIAILAVALCTLIGLSMLRTSRNKAGNSNRESLIESPTSQYGGQNSASSTLASGTVQPPGSTNESIKQETTPLSNSVATSASRQGLGREDYIEQRVGELMDLGMSDDAQALKTILSEVTNPEAEIRKAAIEASKQFGSTNAIPALQEAIANTDSIEDKQDLREAIEFLKLPSFLAKQN
jgi:hypothetical protein